MIKVSAAQIMYLQTDLMGHKLKDSYSVEFMFTLIIEI